MTRIILVRHAQSAPHPDLEEEAYPLSERGREQALALAPVLAELGVEALVSSPYRRAIDTLQPYADQAGLTIAVDPDLRERKLGAGWLPDAEAVNAAVRRMLADPDWSLEGGESGRVSLARFSEALARLLAAHRGRTVAVGSHGGVIAQLLAPQARGPAFDFWRGIRNPHVFVLDADDGFRWLDERTLDGSTLRPAVAPST